MSRALRSPFPYVPLGSAKLFAEATTSWNRLLQDIASAHEEVLFENYIVLDGAAADALLNALSQAKSQGATIRIIVDGAGSFDMSDSLRAQLEDVGELKTFHPLRWNTFFFQFRSRVMQRTHRRIVIVDNQVAWTGGMAVEDPWWKNVHTPYREAMIRLSGPVIGQLRTAFDSLWLDQPVPSPKNQRPAQEEQIRVLPQRARRLSCFRYALLHRIGRSQQRVWLATAYFIPPRRLRSAFISAAKRGVDVRLLLPSAKQHDHPAIRFASRRYYARLLSHGVKIYEYQAAFQHSKSCLFDTDISIVGSPNIDRWSNLWNHEIAVEVNSNDLNQQLSSSFDADFEQSRLITLEDWKARSLWSRFLEYFFGIFDRAF